MQIILSLVNVAEQPPFGKEPLTGLTVQTLCNLVFVILVIYHFGFEGWTEVLLLPDPGYCFHFISHAKAF